METNIKLSFNDISHDSRPLASKENDRKGQLEKAIELPANETSDAIKQTKQKFVDKSLEQSKEPPKTQVEQEEELLAAIDVISAFIEPQIRNVNFTQDESSGKTVVKVFDAESKELIKQFPSEDALALAEKIQGLQNEIVNKTGILIDDTV